MNAFVAPAVKVAVEVLGKAWRSADVEVEDLRASGLLTITRISVGGVEAEGVGAFGFGVGGFDGGGAVAVVGEGDAFREARGGAAGEGGVIDDRSRVASGRYSEGARAPRVQGRAVGAGNGGRLVYDRGELLAVRSLGVGRGDGERIGAAYCRNPGQQTAGAEADAGRERAVAHEDRSGISRINDLEVSGRPDDEVSEDGHDRRGGGAGVANNEGKAARSVVLRLRGGRNELYPGLIGWRADTAGGDECAAVPPFH